MKEFISFSQCLLVSVALSGLTAGCSNSLKSNTNAVVSTAAGQYGELRGNYTLPAPTPCNDDSSLLCYAVAMPLDHLNANSPTTTVTFAVKPSTASSHKQALLVLFGGPGEQAISNLGRWASRIDPAINAQFDIVTMDLRGVANSGAIDCPNAYNQYVFTPQRAGTADDRATLIAAARDMGPNCMNEMGLTADKLQFYNSGEAASDLEAFRRLMSYDKWRIYSLSYGTQLAQGYVTIFPGHTDALVIDGAVDLTADLFAYSRDLTTAQNQIFDQMLANCATLSQCQAAFGATATQPMQDPAAVYSKIHANLLSAPAAITLKNSDGSTSQNTMSAYDLEYALGNGVNDPTARTRFLRALGLAATQNNLAPLYRIASGISVDPDLDPASSVAVTPSTTTATTSTTTTASSYPGMSQGVFFSFICNDYGSPVAGDVDARLNAYVDVGVDFENKGAKIRSPLYAEVPCANWPTAPVAQPRPAAFTAGGIPTIVIGATADAAVPYIYDAALSKTLSNGAFITVAGSQHVSFSYYIQCVNNPVNNLLLTGKLPDSRNIQCTDVFMAPWPETTTATTATTPVATN